MDTNSMFAHIEIKFINYVYVYKFVNLTRPNHVYVQSYKNQDVIINHNCKKVDFHLSIQLLIILLLRNAIKGAFTCKAQQHN